MKEIQFADWEAVLARADLPERKKESWTITIRWYLSYCRRGRAAVTVQSARDFVEWAQAQKPRQPWQVEEWKKALQWFFKAAPRPEPASPRTAASTEDLKTPE